MLDQPEVRLGRRPVLGDVLLEQGVHHDRRRAGVFQPHHHVDVVIER